MLPRWNEGPGLHLSWVVPFASPKSAPDRSFLYCENAQRAAQIAPESAREIGSRGGGCAETARWVARDPAARKAAQVNVRSKFYAMALAEELAILGGSEPVYPLSEVTLLTAAGSLDGAGCRSASSYIAELRLRHVELDFAISPALGRAFKKINDAVTKGPGPVKKAPEVKLSAIKHDVDTLIVGSADAYVISLHWLLRADEAEGLSLEMTSLFLHEGMSGPRDVTLRSPMSKTDPRGNGASRRLSCICKLSVEEGDILPEASPVCAVHRQVSRLHSLLCWAIEDDRAGKPLFPWADGLRASKVQLVQAWGMATAQNEKPSGHSPCGSGAKRYARQGWSVWMIQFVGRWGASTVLEHIEEAMAEVTACWVKRPAGCFTENHEDRSALWLTGSTGGCPKLSERVDRIEQIILDTKTRLEPQCHQLARWP